MGTGKRGRPAHPSQDIPRQIISDYIRANAISLRGLAQRMGLAGHASLSRFLSGRQKLSLASLVLLCQTLGIEGRALEKVLVSQIPKAYLQEAKLNARAKGKRGGFVAKKVGRGAPQKNISFFADQHSPLIYEVAKVLGPATLDEIHQCLHRKMGILKSDVILSMKHLCELGLVVTQGEKWEVLNPNQDIVVPSKYVVKIGLRTVQDTLRTCQNFVNEDSSVRAMRSILTTLSVPRELNSIEIVRPLILKFRDDLLALQSIGDNRIVQVFVSAIEVAKKPS